MKRAADKRTFQRVQAVVVAQGRTIHEVGEIVGGTVQTVYNGVSLYLDQHQVGALEEAPRSGRPVIAKPITKARILRELQRNPLRCGYRTTVWTVQLFAERLSQRYHCQLSPYTLRPKNDSDRVALPAPPLLL